MDKMSEIRDYIKYVFSKDALMHRASLECRTEIALMIGPMLIYGGISMFISFGCGWLWSHYIRPWSRSRLPWVRRISNYKSSLVKKGVLMEKEKGELILDGETHYFIDTDGTSICRFIEENGDEKYIFGINKDYNGYICLNTITEGYIEYASFGIIPINKDIVRKTSRIYNKRFPCETIIGQYKDTRLLRDFDDINLALDINNGEFKGFAVSFFGNKKNLFIIKDYYIKKEYDKIIEKKREKISVLTLIDNMKSLGVPLSFLDMVTADMNKKTYMDICDISCVLGRCEMVRKECRVCSAEYSHVLRCGHEYCKGCIMEFETHSIIQCPACRRTIAFSDGARCGTIAFT